MNEVRFHARKGQGAVEAARILASAFRLAGRDASWHTPYGWEYGVNFEAAVAISEDYRGADFSALIVFFPPLIEVPDVWMGFEHPDLVLVNTRSSLEGISLSDGIGVAMVDATGIAKSVGICSGLPSMVAPMLGAFAATSGAILGAHLISAIEELARSTDMDYEDMMNAIHALELGYDTASISRGRRAVHCDDPEIEKLLWAS